jgi:small subunit ribosomal protein S20
VANTKSAEKAARRAETNRTRNVALRSRMRSALRKVNDALSSGNKAEAMAALKEAQPLVDSLVNKNVIHRNKAARHKSALSARIKALGSSRPTHAQRPRPRAGSPRFGVGKKACATGARPKANPLGVLFGFDLHAPGLGRAASSL